MSPKDCERDESQGRFAYDGLDRVIHEKARLCILTSLATNSKGLLFTDLKEMCSLTDGNLSRHLQILNESGMIEMWKGHHFKRPKTLIRLTSDGRKRFLEYVAVLEKVVADAMAETAPSEAPSISEGWAPV